VLLFCFYKLQLHTLCNFKFEIVLFLDKTQNLSGVVAVVKGMWYEDSECGDGVTYQTILMNLLLMMLRPWKFVEV